jgi:hypothetical protein
VRSSSVASQERRSTCPLLRPRGLFLRKAIILCNLSMAWRRSNVAKTRPGYGQDPVISSRVLARSLLHSGQALPHSDQARCILAKRGQGMAKTQLGYENTRPEQENPRQKHDQDLAKARPGGAIRKVVVREAACLQRVRDRNGFPI